ncbi:putative Myb/SANT-like domain-containing protein [Arabidopsis thaliana]|uniref:Emb/CAB88131.1 n=3 Tax=Arabidopsis TaxID=3701 RepID=Q9LVZ0_ARATH|nr:Myb/SANT-like DNA-binding domain protein [Arabidopsis thaliana]AED94042.1 Myb/SANT-like DNA-binding domain protein [Arabidopsis thaliana]KAG7603988.1 Myb/SANT-like domain [Arabidopsis thaliana x Arabidopsis arenosa]KAG7610898.1 Myb/SANT-like domain [Arabidopsis suecica]BAA96882.1 unnamed protein product [Arabidopsis thaliana]|eukprot:NP_198457.1 Myb/SANT-like DNA-binding domain protein [Arabidopsis thaliana]
MNNYTIKHPTSIGRDYMVEKFNQVFNMNRTYVFFKNKHDELKKSYKGWKFLTHKTGISVDPKTSMIFAYDVWWREREFVGVEVVHKDLGEAHKFLLEVVHEEIVEDNLLKQLYKTLLLVIENFNDKVFNNFVPMLLTKMITMNLKRQKRYLLR